MSIKTDDVKNAVEKHFSTYDKDKDGYLDFQEATELMKYLFDMMGNTEDEKQVFKFFFSLTDKNSDKKLSKEELCSLIGSAGQDLGNEKQEEKPV